MSVIKKFKDMYNHQIDKLTDYPFKRLDALLSSIPAPRHITPIMMSIGEPQHPAPSLITEELRKNSSLWNKYPSAKGTIEFRLSVKKWLLKRFNLHEDTLNSEKNILPLAGSREGLYMSAQLTVSKSINGEKPIVLIPNPFYQVYLGAAILSNAEILMLDLNENNNYQPEISNLDKNTLERISTYFICNPSNPQGTVASKKYLINIIKLARRYNFTIISDECYSEIYTKSPPPSLLEAALDIGDGLKNIMVFNSLSKRSSVPGLRSGFVVGDEVLIEKFFKLRSHACAVQPLPIMAVATKLWEDEKHVVENRNLYKDKILSATQLIDNKINFKMPEGGFFLWLNVKDGCKAAIELWSKAGIKVLPGKFLCRQDKDGLSPGDQYIRVALVNSKEKTINAIRTITNILAD